MLPTIFDLERDGQVVRNVEALARSVLNRLAVARPLEPADYDEALAFLIGEAYVIAAERWPPRRDRYPVLGAYLSVALPTALIDYLRKVAGRDGTRRALSREAFEHAARAAGSDDDDWSPSEVVDERSEAQVEDLVLGRVGSLKPRARVGAAA